MDPSNNDRTETEQGAAWTVPILLAIGTAGISQGLSALWRYLRHIEKNDTQDKICWIFNEIFGINSAESNSSNTDPEIPTTITAIDKAFTSRPIEEQKKAHNIAKAYLEKRLSIIGAEVTFVSPIQKAPQLVDSIKIQNDLDKSVFSWQNTTGVQHDIQKDSTNSSLVVLYGVASQFNSCEAPDRFTPDPGRAFAIYCNDLTQGPLAQLQFPLEQVELINDAANIGFNGLCQVLDDATKENIQHGYFSPSNAFSQIIIQQLVENGHKIEFPCIGNVPTKPSATEKVYEMLVAAPAFGMYQIDSLQKKDQNEIEYLCALQGYRAQFQQIIQLAENNPQKKAVFKPTAPGLGVFGNKAENVAKAFYVAAKENESQLREKNISVQLQVFRGTGPAREMANRLYLTSLTP
jgi:hypothetical protein